MSVETIQEAVTHRLNAEDVGVVAAASRACRGAAVHTAVHTTVKETA